MTAPAQNCYTVSSVPGLLSIHAQFVLNVLKLSFS